MSIDLDRIKEKVQDAEYAAIHVQNNSSVWFKYYGDTPANNPLINDFKAMVREIEKMRATIFNLECKLEAAGIEVEEK